MSISKTFIADSIILAIVCLMLLVMTWLTYKVYKITKFQDKILLLMLFFLDLTLMSNFLLVYLKGHIIFYTIRILIYAEVEVYITECGAGMISILPVFCFSIAVLFNINKW